MRFPCYVGELTTTELAGNKWRLESPFGFIGSRGELIAVPPGRISNGWTTPWVFRRWYPVNRQLSSAFIHDALCAEHLPAASPDERGWVLPIGVEAVYLFARDMQSMPTHVFEAEMDVLGEYAFRVDCERAAGLFREAMSAWINPIPRPMQMAVGWAVDVFGPRWTA